MLYLRDMQKEPVAVADTTIKVGSTIYEVPGVINAIECFTVVRVSKYDARIENTYTAIYAPISMLIPENGFFTNYWEALAFSLQLKKDSKWLVR